MFKTLRALVSHPMTKAAVAASMVGAGLAMLSEATKALQDHADQLAAESVDAQAHLDDLTAQIERRLSDLTALDRRISQRLDQLDALQVPAQAGPPAAESYPSAEDVDPLGNGIPNP